ncbi:MAG: LamG-like jellyroll fold domain-containing protein [Candidatus Brocadiia bacterium]
MKMKISVMLAVIALSLVTTVGVPEPRKESPRHERCSAADPFLYLAPSFADRVVYYDPFEEGLGAPAVNRIDAQVSRVEGGKLVPGFTGKALRCPPWDHKPHRFYLVESEALSPHRPLTLMLWWRPDKEMNKHTGYHLVALRGKGYIADFVRGAGNWCGLTRPTHVLQVYRFPGISNHNGIWGNRHATFPAGKWHHAALVVESASVVKVFWDGELKKTYRNKGRRFRPGETDTAHFGRHYGSFPMSIDEIVVLDRALDREEIQRYVTACRRLREIGIPYRESIQVAD